MLTVFLVFSEIPQPAKVIKASPVIKKIDKAWSEKVSTWVLLLDKITMCEWFCNWATGTVSCTYACNF